MDNIYLSVVVPAYGEEKRIGETLEAIGKYFKSKNYNYEIIVVNDGSKDNTAGVVLETAKKIPNIRLIDNKINHGKGYVVRQGMLEARGFYRLFTDSDNSTPIEEVEKLLPYLSNGYDLAIGSRDLPDSHLEPPQPFYRRFLGRGWWVLTSFFVGTWGISDTQCGFKLMTAAAAKEIMPLCRIDRFAFDPEILAIARKKKLKVKEVGITWRNDLRSTVKFKSMVKMFIDLIKISLNIISGVYDKPASSSPKA